jgi:hypothetical protein
MGHRTGDDYDSSSSRFPHWHRRHLPAGVMWCARAASGLDLPGHPDRPSGLHGVRGISGRPGRDEALGEVNSEMAAMTKRAYGLAGLALFLLAVLIAQRSGVL